MLELFQLITVQLEQQSMIETLAVFFALAYVWLAAKQNILCWPSALISTSLYTWIFWEVSLPFNSALNFYYLIMAVYGWYKWNGGGDENELKITSWPLVYHVFACAILIVAGIILSHLVTMSWLKSELYLDALVTVFSVYTMFLVTQKLLENWLFWMVINFFAAYLYFDNGLILTGLLFVGYFGLAIYGYFEWKKSVSLPSTSAN